MAQKPQNEKLFLQLINGYGKAFPYKSKQNVQSEVSKLWRDMKKNSSTELRDVVGQKLQEWKKAEMKHEGRLLSFWGKIKKSAVQQEQPTNLDGGSSSTESTSTDLAVLKAEGDMDSKQVEQPNPKRNTESSKSTPKQDQLHAELCTIQDYVNELYKKKGCGMLTVEEREVLRKNEQKITDMKKQLKQTKQNQERQKKYRENFKRKIEELDDDTRKKLKGNPSSARGRPPKVENEDQLHKAIIDIAIGGSAADERRRSEVIRTVRTLSDLTTALQKQGFQLSRSSVYLRLLPRNSVTQEGKRHVKTVPVKLMKSENSEHAHHPDTHFARASISFLEELASLLGPTEVTFNSQDDKARVPIGITAANKQAPLIMHMEYKVTLSDHDFVVAPKHKLIPSVIAAISIKKNSINEPGVTYSGPTYIGIRSAKHTSSTAVGHLRDMKRVRGLPEFNDSMSTPDGLPKPVMIMTVDGGPDENPRYANTIRCAVTNFITFGLDALFIATNAPGRSAFNRVERRMAPLSHDIAGVVLPQDHFGSHLNSNGETVNEKLEEDNFAHAGKVLADIWSGTVIDGHPTVAEYVDPDKGNDPEIIEKDPAWHAKHVQESQYFLQIIKCTDRACCEQPRSSYFSVIKDRFLPSPLPLAQTNDGLCCALDDSSARYPSLFVNLALDKCVLPARAEKKFPKGLPYDFACPSLQTVLPKRICGQCGKYFASIKSLKSHGMHCRTTTQNNVSSGLPAHRARPQRLAAKRQRELMCVIRYMESESDEFEWHDEVDVDTSGLEVPQSNMIENGTPIMSVKDRQPLWQEEI